MGLAVRVGSIAPPSDLDTRSERLQGALTGLKASQDKFAAEVFSAAAGPQGVPRVGVTYSA